MIIRTLTICIAIGLAVAGMAGAWGLPAALSTSSSSSYGDPDGFLSRARNAEALTDNSADSIYKAVASKEEQAKMEELQKKLIETTDDKEKNALRHQITESEMATIEKRAKDQETQEQAKNWDDKKKKYVADAFYNLSLGSLQAALLVPEGTAMASAISNNPANAIRLAIKVTSVLEAVKSLGGVISNTAKVTAALKPLMSAAKIDAKAPASAADKPKDASKDI
ncbi:MAG: hypothetical protein WCP10_04540 [Desulfuromonadales bacterium]